MELTPWTPITANSTPWSGDVNATTTTLVDDLFCLVDDLLIQVDGYDSVKYPSETINNTVWS